MGQRTAMDSRTLSTLWAMRGLGAVFYPRCESGTERRSNNRKMAKFSIGRGAALIALATLGACASTTTDTASTDAAETVVPERRAQTTRQAGPAPGSYADLKENAGHRVFFGYNQYNLTPSAQQVLAKQAGWLKKYPGTRIRLEGNADERGTREYNLALGARRANEAKAYLVGLGVQPSRIMVISNGKERPIDRRSTPQAWAMNRNSTTVVVGSTGS